MSILKVCRLGHPVLRQHAARVTAEALASPAIQSLIDDMIQTMDEYHGVGLAAPQVHESLAIAVIESRGPRGEIPLTVIVNPTVTVLKEESTGVDLERIDDWEGCLSIPEFRGLVPRHPALEVTAFDRKGREQRFRAEGFFARVVQHEYDHLMGHVYLDRMSGLKTLTHLEEFQRFWLPQQADEDEEE